MSKNQGTVNKKIISFAVCNFWYIFIIIKIRIQSRNIHPFCPKYALNNVSSTISKGKIIRKITIERMVVLIYLTHRVIVTPIRDLDLDQYWLRQWVITYFNVHLSLVKVWGLRLRTISQRRHKLLFHNDLENCTVRIIATSPGANDLKPTTNCGAVFMWIISILVDYMIISLQWHPNEHDGVSNHQPHECLLNLLCRRRSKKTSKLRVTGLCAGNSSVTGEFLAQKGQ